jgi:hypothetical protein
MPNYKKIFRAGAEVKHALIFSTLRPDALRPREKTSHGGK